MTPVITSRDFAEADRQARSARRNAYTAELNVARDALRDAEDGFRAEIRRTVPGARSELGAMQIDNDLDELFSIGVAIANAARMLNDLRRKGRTISPVIPARLAATLMAESLDGQLPAHAWSVVASAAELVAVGGAVDGVREMLSKSVEALS